MEYYKDEFIISTDKSKIDLTIVHDFLSHSYWAQGISIDIIKRSIENSLCFGIYDADKQVGFARVISDFATYAYLADVFVVEDVRGKGLGKWLMTVIKSHPQLQGLRRFMLATKDAHALYAQYDFLPMKRPERWMECHDPDVYTRK